MRITLLFAIALVLFCHGIKAQDKLKLVWNDEFDYNGLPDSTKWTYELGFIRNREKQYYTSDLHNVSVHNGVLEINGIKENHPNLFYKKNSEDWRTNDSLANYTSASINTLGKASWKFGRIEVRAKIPRGLGVWPAVWMMGINRSEVRWPACGEIDIMEFVGHDSAFIFGSIHYRKEDSPEKHGSSHNKIQALRPYDDFHLYTLEWDSTQIKIFFDNKLYHLFDLKNADTNGDNPFRKPFYILLNLALGGAWGGNIDDTNLPQSFFVDYVRVYQ